MGLIKTDYIDGEKYYLIPASLIKCLNIKDNCIELKDLVHEDPPKEIDESEKESRRKIIEKCKKEADYYCSYCSDMNSYTGSGCRYSEYADSDYPHCKNKYLKHLLKDKGINTYEDVTFYK